MNKLKLVFVAISTVFAGNTIQAGGLLTNTNQHVAFNRMMSREVLSVLMVYTTTLRALYL